MGSSTLSRILTAGAFSAVLAAATAGTAAAAPPSDHEPTRSTTGSAFAFLSGPESAVFLDAFAPPGEDSFATLEIFVAGFECLTEERIPAVVDDLTSASATGELTLTCGSAEGEVLAHAVVDVAWEGEGPISPSTFAGRGMACVVRVLTRQATVTGTVQVTIPELGIDETARPGEGELREATELCPPRRD